MNAYYENVFSKYQESPVYITAQEDRQETSPQPPRQVRIQQPSLAPEQSRIADIYTYPQNLRDALQLIEDAINRETEDELVYDNLIKMAPTEDNAVLKQMQSEDINNYMVLRRIYTELTGQEPPLPNPLSSVPKQTNTYCEGLERGIAIADQEIPEYTRILYALQSRPTINMMFGIIMTEIRHSNKLVYLYFKNQCK